MAKGLVVPIPTFPAKYAFPVVVAPPDTVRPVVCPPAPIVDEAREYIPFVNPMSVDVEFAFVDPNVVEVKGKSPPLAEGHVVLHISPVIQIVVAESAVVLA